MGHSTPARRGGPPGRALATLLGTAAPNAPRPDVQGGHAGLRTPRWRAVLRDRLATTAAADGRPRLPSVV